MINFLYKHWKSYYIWAPTVLLLSILVVEIVLTTLIPDIKSYFFNILENKNSELFLYGISLYFAIYLWLSFVQTAKYYVSTILGLHWRTIITKLLTKKWVYSDKTTKVDNPAQRINEDVRLCTELTIYVINEIIISLFIVVVIIIQMRHSGWLLGASILYTLIGLGLTYGFNNTFKRHDINLQSAEASHRTSLAKIALDMGDFTSKANYINVTTNYKAYIRIKTYYLLFFRGHGGISAAVPMLLLVPSYFAGTMSFGDVMGGVAQFELIVLNLGIIMNLYPEIIKAQASWERVLGFWKELDK